MNKKGFMGEDIENIIRRLSIKQMEVLSTFIPTGKRQENYINVEMISKSIQNAADNKKTAVCGIISGLAQVKTNNGYLISPAGRDEKGLRWILNEKIITREDLKDILLQIPGLEV